MPRSKGAKRDRCFLTVLLFTLLLRQAVAIIHMLWGKETLE